MSAQRQRELMMNQVDSEAESGDPVAPSPLEPGQSTERSMISNTGRRQSRLSALALIAPVLFGLALAVRMTQGSSNPVWYEAASKAFSQGRVAEAQQILLDGLSHQPSSIAALELLADCEIASRKYIDAMVTLRRIQMADRTRPHVATRLAEASVGSSPPECLEAAREAVIQEPRSPRARLLLAWAMARVGAADDAVLEAKVVDQLNGSDEVQNSLHADPSAIKSAPELTRVLRDLVYHVPY